MKRDRVYVMPTWLSVVAINYEEHAINSVARYTPVDHKMNEEILEELHVTSFERKLCTYRYNWFRHVPRMEDYRLHKQLLKLSSKRKTMTWTTTEETTRRRECRDRKRPPWHKFVMEHDGDDDDDDNDDDLWWWQNRFQLYICLVTPVYTHTI
jgi:hypothetical protein